MPHDPEHQGFFDWIERALKPRALEQNIKPQAFSRAMATARFRPDVLEHQTSQKEFSLPIWEYIDIAASEERARNGRQMFRKHRELLNRIESAFAVEPEVIMAIWGLETAYGAVCGDVPALSALATLAYRGRRARFFEEELIAALKLIEAGDCHLEELVGSWAGAIGHGQFLPSSITRYGVDFDDDGKMDLCGADPTDALASIGNYLKENGWKKGQPWGLEVLLPQGFDYARTGLDETHPSPDWAARGVTDAVGRPVANYGPGSILLPAGTNGVALLVLRNFHVIKRYNHADAYAIAVGHLSDRILGSRGFKGTWPRQDPVLSQGDIAEIQSLLSRSGFDTKGIDGLLGPNTTRAIRAWQQANGFKPDGYCSAKILAQLHAQQGH